MMRRFWRATKGSVITEFSLASLVLFLSLLTSAEYAVELFVRESFQREAIRGALVYSELRSKADTDQWLEVNAAGYLGRCLEPVEVQLFSHVAGVDLSGNAAGFTAQDNPGDLAGEVARVTLSCRWTRIGPLMRATLGAEQVFSSDVIVRMRD